VNALYQEHEDVNSGISLSRVFWALKARIWLIAVCFLFGLLISYLFLSLVAPKYKASAQFLFDPAAEQLASPEPGSAPNITNFKALERVIALIQSPGTLKQVALTVMSDPAFRDFRPETSIRAAVADAALDDDARMRQLIAILEKGLSIKTEAADQIVIVEYQSKSAQEAAYVTNLIVRTFIQERAAARKLAISQATKWLDERVADAKEKLMAVDEKIEDYKAEHKIDSETGASAYDKQLIALREQSGILQNKLSDAESLYDALQSNVSGANYSKLAEILDSPSMEKLRAALAAAEAEMAAAKIRLGTFHPEVQGKQAHIEAIRSEIVAEARRKLIIAKNDVDALRSRQQGMKVSIESLEQKVQGLRAAEVQLRELLRERAAIKTLYDSALTKLMQTAPHQVANFSEFRLLLDAAVPSRPKIDPLLIWIGGCFAGLGMGIVLSLILEYASDRLVHLDEVEKQLPAPAIARLPIISDKDFTADGKIDVGRKRANFADFTKQFPNSLFTSALANAKIAIAGLDGAKANKVIMITSALQGEGKTNISFNLASLSAMLGEKTLLIDLDTRKETKAEENAGAVPCPELTAYLDETRLSEHLTAARNTADFDVLRSSSPEEAVWLRLFRPQMRDLLEFARNKYDQVWIDTPPAQMFADALVLAKQVDGFILVAEWSKTSKKQLRDTHDLIVRSGGNVLGIIVNKVKVDSVISEYMTSCNNYYRKSDERGYFRHRSSVRPLSKKLKVES